MKNCLTCKWLEEPGERHIWHQCVWPAPALVPKCVQVIYSSINVAVPFSDCAAWEAITPPSKAADVGCTPTAEAIGPHRV